MEGGELFERIVKKARYSELEARECVKTILETMAYLHKRNIAHRDLKPENLLLTSMDDDGDIKVADFGFAKHIQTDKEDDGGGGLDTQCGTPGYVAPEILSKQKYPPPPPTNPTTSGSHVSKCLSLDTVLAPYPRYGVEVDVWSIGVM